MTTEELRAAMSVRKQANFSELVGKWTSDPAFDDVVASQRQIDPDKWN